MLKVGLTGGIGSGKTTVAKIFALLNVPVYFADEASKRLYQTDSELRRSIREHFGDDIFPNNVFDKTKLAAVVFNNPQQLELLNSIVHPRTIQDAEDWMERQQAPYVIKEAALLFESGSASGLDYVIGVKAPTHYRVQRVMERDGVTREGFFTRANRQIDEDIKLKLCDFIITNNEQELVIPQVLALHARLTAIAAG